MAHTEIQALSQIMLTFKELILAPTFEAGKSGWKELKTLKPMSEKYTFDCYAMK